MLQTWDRRTVVKIVESLERGISLYLPARSVAILQRHNEMFTEVDQTIFNAISCNNSYIQKELQI